MNIIIRFKGSELSGNQNHKDTAMIAFDVSNDKVTKLQASLPGEKVTPLHVTLLYLGDIAGLDKASIINIIREFASNMAPIHGSYNGIGMFQPEDGNVPVVLLYDSP